MYNRIKKSYKVIIVTAIMLLNILFTTTVGTNAFFLKNRESGVLAYITSLDDLFQDELNIVRDSNKSTIDNIVLNITFSKDTRYSDDTYEFKFADKNSACSFVYGTTDGKYTFGDNPEGGYITISCPVTKDEDINIDLNLYETINYKDTTKNEEFLYKTGHYEITYNNYFNLFTFYPENGIIKTDSTNIYSEFMAIIEKYVEEQNKIEGSFIKTNKLTDLTLYNKYFDSYLLENGITDAELTALKTAIENKREIDVATNKKIGDALFKNNLNDFFLGVYNEKTLDSNNNEGYKFGFDPNYVGYALESDYYSSTTASGIIIYLSTDEPVYIEKAIIKTIDKWLFNNDNKFLDSTFTNKELAIKYICDYMSTKSYIYNIDNLALVPGIRRTMDENQIAYVYFNDLFLNLAYNYSKMETNTIKIAYNTQPTIMASVFRYGIMNLITDTDEQDILKNIIDSIYNESSQIYLTNSDLYESITCISGCDSVIKTFEYSNDFYKYTLNITHNNTVNNQTYNEVTVVKKNIKSIGYDTINKKYLYFENDIQKSEHDKLNEVLKLIYTDADEINALEQILQDIITCEKSDSNTCTLNKVYFIGNKYYTISMNQENAINKVTIDKYNTFAELTNTNITSERLDTAVTCNENCSEFNEVYYDYRNSNNKKFIAVNVNPTENPIVKAISLKDDYDINSADFGVYTPIAEIFTDSDIGWIIESIGFDPNWSNISICETPENCRDLYQMYYANNEYLKLKVEHNFDRGFNTFILEESNNLDLYFIDEAIEYQNYLRIYLPETSASIENLLKEKYDVMNISQSEDEYVTYNIVEKTNS